MDMAEDVPRVFVSHASQDAEVAARTTALIDRAGLRAWTAVRDVPAGADHGEVVPRAIASSDAMLLLLSSDALTSPWVLRDAAELVAGLFRAGSEEDARALAADFRLTREERWPAFQPRGWDSTRPQDARAGVM